MTTCSSARAHHLFAGTVQGGSTWWSTTQARESRTHDWRGVWAVWRGQLRAERVSLFNSGLMLLSRSTHAPLVAG